MKLTSTVWLCIGLILIGVGVYLVLHKSTVTSTPTATNPAQYVNGNLLLGTDGTGTLGTYLIGYNGMTLYTKSTDQGGSTCTGACAVTWPPYVIQSIGALANTQAGVSGTVSAVTRADGQKQVLYNNKPLYFYSGDTVSGDTKGNGVGGVWSVVAP